MLARRAAQRPQGILQPLRQRDITLAAQDHMGMLEARTGEPEVVQPVIKPDPGDVYTQIGHIGKIRQPHPTRLVHLADDHVAIRTEEHTSNTVTNAPLVCRLLLEKKKTKNKKNETLEKIKH